MTIEELQVLITGETRDLRKSLDQVKKQLERTDREVSKVTRSINKTLRTIGATLASLGLGAFFISASKDAMQFEAALMQIQRLMGSSANEFQRWVDTQAKAFGFARSEAIQYGAVYANLLSGFSNGTAETMQRTQDLLQASAVIASATGRTMEDVMERIRSGLLGNTEAIEDLGVNVNVALIESTAAFRRFANGKSWQQLDFNTQQTIRYFAILEQTVQKYGNELAQNTATRQAQFIAQLKDIRLYLGQAFLPIYNTILPALTRMAAALANAARYLAAFSQALFGYQQPQQTAQTEAQASAVSDLGDAYEKAGKQAKGAIAGFDQLNLVGGTIGEGSAGSALFPASETETGALSMVTAMDEVSQKAREMADKVRSAFSEMSGFIRRNSDIIISALSGVGTAIGAAFLITKWDTIVAGISKAMKAIRGAIAGIIPLISGISWPIVAASIAIGALVGGFVYFYRTNEKFRGVVDGILQKIGEVAMWLWQNVMVPFGQWLQDVWPIVWDAVGKATEWLWKNVLAPFGDFLIWLWNEVLVPIGKVVGDVLVVAFKAVIAVVREFWQKVLVPLGEALTELVGPAVEAVLAVLKPFGRYIKNELTPVVEALIDGFEWLWKDVLKPLATYLGKLFMPIVSNVFDSLGALIDGLKTALIGLMNFITGAFTDDWKRAWNGVKDIFKGVFDSLWAIVKFPLNLIIDGINTLIGGLNKFSIDIPDWLADLTGTKAGKFGINIPKIPKLDVGTNYIPRDMLAVLHEGEAVVPKKFNPAAGGTGLDMSEAVSLLRQILSAIQSGRNINLSISRDAIGSAASEFIVDRARRGQNPIAPAL